MFGDGQVPEVDEFHRFDTPMDNAPLARWERKALEQQQQLHQQQQQYQPASTSIATNTSCQSSPQSKKTPKRTPSGKKTPQADRFIPNRATMNMDICRMNLNFDKENAATAVGSNNPNQVSSGDHDSQTHGGSTDDMNRNGSAEYHSALAQSLLSCNSSGSLGSLHSTNLSHSSSLNLSGDMMLNGDEDFMNGGENARTPMITNPSNVQDDEITSKILSFRTKAPTPKDGYVNSLRVLYSQNAASTHNAVAKKKTFRHVSQAPEKILDAPDILDDYYLNLLDWNRNNILAVALGQVVYLWNASTGSIEQLCETSPSSADNYISSVSWIQEGNILAVGTANCDLQLWDVESMKQLRSMPSHTGRVSALAWNGPTLSSGSRDSTIHHHDVRIQHHHVATLAGAHQQEICGLKWSPTGTQLASGGNDNLLNIWDAGQHAGPRFTLNHHTAAVKALAWCPWQSGLLASGGGTADRMLRFWNTSSGACVNSIDTKSQVCSIVWNPHDKELVTSHGFSQNQLTLWKYPSLTRMAELTGHTSRVLHTALSADGTTVVSGAADETLRFWKLFEAPVADAKKAKAAAAGLSAIPDSAGNSRGRLRGLNIR